MTTKMEKYRSDGVDALPDLLHEQSTIALGSFGWTYMNEGRRLLLNNYTMAFAGGLTHPGEVARMYLTAKYGDQKRRINRYQYADFNLQRSPPMFAKPCILDGAVYVDIKAAYWSIVQAVGWDVDYLAGSFVGVRSVMDDFPFAGNKLARNLLVTAGLPKSLRLWTGTKLVTKKSYNPLLNGGIWAICQDVLNGIAAEMVALGAVYVHTDGYVLPAARAQDALGIIADWGLVGSVKNEGSGWVAGVGTYRVGVGVSKRKLHNPAPHPANFYTPHASWLKRIIRAWADRRLIV